MPMSFIVVSLRFFAESVTAPMEPLNDPIALIVSADSKISCTLAGYFGAVDPNT